MSETPKQQEQEYQEQEQQQQNLQQEQLQQQEQQDQQEQQEQYNQKLQQQYEQQQQEIQQQEQEQYEQHQEMQNHPDEIHYRQEEHQEQYFPEENHQNYFQNHNINFQDSQQNQQRNLQYSPSQIRNEIQDSKNQSPFKSQNKDYGDRYNKVISKLKDSVSLGDLARRYNNINFPKSGSKSGENENMQFLQQEQFQFNSGRKSSPSKVGVRSSSPGKINFNNNNFNNNLLSSPHSKLNSSFKNNQLSNQKNFNLNLNNSYSHSPIKSDLSRKSFIKNGGFGNPNNIELLRSSGFSILSKKNFDSAIPNILHDIQENQKRLRSPVNFRASSNLFNKTDKISLQDAVQQQGLHNRSPLKFTQNYKSKLNIQSSPFGKILKKGVVLSPKKGQKFGNNFQKKSYVSYRPLSPKTQTISNSSAFQNLLSTFGNAPKSTSNNSSNLKNNFQKFLKETHLGSPSNSVQQQAVRRAISPQKYGNNRSPQKNSSNKFDFNLANSSSNNFFSQSILNRKQSQRNQIQSLNQNQNQNQTQNQNYNKNQNYPSLLQKNSSTFNNNNNSNNYLRGSQGGLDGLISNLQKKRSNLTSNKGTQQQQKNFSRMSEFEGDLNQQRISNLFGSVASPTSGSRKTASFANNFKKY